MVSVQATGHAQTVHNLAIGGLHNYHVVTDTGQAILVHNDQNPLTGENGACGSSGKTFVVAPRGTTFDVSSGWAGRTADNGRGIVFQKPGSLKNQNSIRIMEPTPQYPNGYVRVYNGKGGGAAYRCKW